VWICSPSQFHAEQIKACARAGKHVFCEKPVATDIPETVEAINACSAAGVKLFVALQRRFDPNFARVKRGILEGEASQAGAKPLTCILHYFSLCDLPACPSSESLKHGA
jgi:predicted dehydrogenase